MDRDLSVLELLAIFIDWIETAEHTIVAALGVDAEGRKHPLGLSEGNTENKSVCQALLNNLLARGLDPERPILAVIDGGKGIRTALKATFGDHVLIARCRQHKRKNVLDHLPEAQRTFVGRKLDKAWKEVEADQAEQELRALARQLQADHPGAAASLREGLEETLTVTRRIRTPGVRGRRASPGALRWPWSRLPRIFWAWRHLQQLGGATVDGEFGLQLADSSTGRDQLSPLRRRQAGFQSPVDTVLAAPAVHRLVADPKVASDVLDAAPGRDEIQHTLANSAG
jgi:hypothetical protein